MKKVLTIAGSDSSGGAGIQADLKTMTAYGVYGMSVITALTAQNTTGVYGVLEVSPEFTALQIDSVFSDIRPDAVKIGMVSNGLIIEAIAKGLTKNNAQNIVVDPVMVSTSGSRLMNEDALCALKSKLFPIADVITPNIPEACILCGFKIEGKDDMERAARVISDESGHSVLLKGGHMTEDACDVLYKADGTVLWFDSKRIDNPNTHGTGCTLSSAIASGLALGLSLELSIDTAKKYINGALSYGLNLGKGSGPLNHAHAIQGFCCHSR